MEMATLSSDADTEHWVLNGIQTRAEHAHSQTSTETQQLITYY